MLLGMQPELQAVLREPFRLWMSGEEAVLWVQPRGPGNRSGHAPGGM